ncbi:6-pyruvoyl tetrahydrobiopterin synthase [Chelonus insularis]|uniref:6-pyruvoyl tetrahydrobiopterin synthase n=1 Tax=Chelonus insularis TaxID=460826 RepID=UPI00158A34BB|nr:6-pyruvoyl tetrahydrobiopterin synthase [Chelonus insularis]
MSPIAYLTRKESISCAHRLHSPHLTDEENQSIYGKCNNLWGHGHNYTVEVTVRGPVNPTTGMVMNITDLKCYMKKVLMEQLDHKNLDQDVPYFKTTVSTTENLAIYIFDELKTLMPDPSLLYEVKVFETDKNTVSYRGNDSIFLRST